MFVIQRVRYTRGPGSYIRIDVQGSDYGFGPAILSNATKFPSSSEAIGALVKRTLSFPDLATDRFQLVEIAEKSVEPTYDVLRVL